MNLIVHALFRHGYTLENVAAEELIGESRKDYMQRNEKSLRSKQILFRHALVKCRNKSAGMSE